MRLPWEDPRSKLLSLEELRRNYKASREQFRNEPQQGKRLRGATPLELWQERMARKPLRKLPPEMEYLISTHKREMALTEKGIAISLGRWDKACYYSAELGRWVGHRRERVLVFRNIFDPSRITVSDLKRREFLSVPRQQLPAKSATRAQIAATERHKRGFIEQATGRFGRLTHPLQHTVIRDNEHTDAAKALGDKAVLATDLLRYLYADL